MENRERFYKALATAFVITVGLLLWLGAIASILCSCASHKERTEIHRSDSTAITKENTELRSSSITDIFKSISIDSIIIEDVVKDSACSETAQAPRKVIIHGFKASTSSHTTSNVDVTSDKVAKVQSHRSDSVQYQSETKTAGAALIRLTPSDYILSVAIFFIIVCCVIKNKFSRKSSQ